MAFPNDNRTVLAIGAGLAVLAAIVLGLVFTSGRSKTLEAPPAAQGGLTVNLAEAPTLDVARELRCFVDGQFVGMATLADCARRNGLATDALDVGLDASGALAAAPTAAFAPPPRLPDVEVAPQPQAPITTTVEPSRPAAAPVASSATACLRFTGSEWRSMSGNTTLNACVQQLYAGTCVRPGEAQYGRYGDITLRLVPRRVEQSSDNSHFRVLAQQDRDCQFRDLG